ncbi:MAG: biotin/lipoyl-containing protein, partial [Parasphingopyxis sp.]
MATYKFKLPDIGEGIAEAEIVAWHVKVGDEVEEDQGIADVMTDKATVEMESPVSGKVLELNGEEGEMLAIGSVLAVIETDDIPDEDDVAPVDQEAAPEPAEEEPAEAASEPDVAAPAPAPAPPPAAEAPPAPSH